MSNKILIKRGSGAPTTSDLDNYEIAYDTGANKLYIRDGSDIIPFAAIVDEDNFASDDANRVPSQQSTKAYIASELAAAGAGDITAVVAGDGLTGGANSGSATLDIGAGTGIDVAADAISVDVSDFMSNGANNRVLTATGTDAMNAESSLLFSGSTLEINNSGDWSYILNNTNSGGLRLGTKDSGGTLAYQIELSNTGNYVKLNENTTVNGNISVTGSMTLDSVAVSAVQTSSESFADNNTSLMTSAAINDRITSFNYLTAHPSISAASSSDNSGRTYIQDITVDSNGHVTGIATATETVTDTTYSAGTGLSLSSTTFSTDDSEIVHDNLSGFVSNEHINHTSVSILGGAGLTGGGTIAASRNIHVGAGTGITVNADNVAINFKDEDNMASNSASHAATQQSIKAYVDAEVAGVVNSAPSALNTLDELAAALGDDANFATTTSTALGNRLRVDTSSQGLTGTQQANAITNLGITATKAELNYVDGVTSAIQTQLNAKLTSSSSLNGSNISSGTVAAARIANLAASKITSGTFDAARIAHNSFDIGDTTAETGRNVHETGIYTFNRNSGTLGTGTASGYYSVLAFGQGAGGSAQIGAQWYSGTPNLYFRTLRDTTDDWQDWQRLLTTSDEGSGNGLDADTLDGVEGTGYTRKGVQSGTPNTASNRTTFTCNDAIETSNGNQSGLEVWQDTSGADAFMTFHVAGDYAGYFGLDGSTNDLSWGGWSNGNGNKYRVFHAGNSTNITSVGTISTGTWNGSVIASAYLDSDTAHLSGSQTFSGAKTFSDSVRITGGTKYLYLDNDDESQAGLWFRDNQDQGGQYAKIFFNSGGSNPLSFYVKSGTAVLQLASSTATVNGNIAVSGTVDGRDVASDGSKLDGIESGATADQSASEILTAIKTVDGGGSGLDADTLDGIQSSSFLRSDATDTATGTLTLAAQTWNGHITWNAGNINVGGESSFDVSGSGVWQVWDSGTGAPFIMCDVGQRTEIGSAGSRGLLVHGELESSSLDCNGNANIDGNVTLAAGHYFTAHNESMKAKYRMYGGSDLYAIGMVSGISYGGLNDWSMTFQFNDEADRGFVFRDQNHSNSQGAMAITTNGKATIAHSLRVGYGESDTTTPGATYRLDVSGSIGATADVVAYISSDERLKENIENIKNPLEKLEKLNGVEFDWNDKQDLYQGHDIGVIAQEVEEVLPEIVDTREDGYKAVKYDRIVALLIESIKELKAEVEELKK